MLRVFVSSTFRDLSRERKRLLDKLELALVGVGMENFIPDGKTSQEIGIRELQDSDLVIFLISPHYGSILEECSIDNCPVEDCPMKRGVGKISYTHCEYKVALVENKPHQAYLVDKGWDMIDILKGWKKIDWAKIRGNHAFDGFKNEEIKQYYSEVAKLAWQFKEEVEREFCPRISDIEDIETITDHLANNIVNWYSEGRINLKDFCGRRKVLKDLLEKMDESVEVYGVGGIGKTTLIHVALLIQKLMGKRIVAMGTKQSYVTGSGYKYFREKCREDQHEIIGNDVILDNVIDALSLSGEEREKAKERGEKLRIISDKIEEANIILFIDDFHLADEDVQELVKSARGGVVLASKRKVGVARKEIPLSGIDKKERDKLIDLIASNFDKVISDEAKEKIKKIAEGHPVSTEIVVRNYENINFRKLEGYKHGLDFSNPAHVQEFLTRVVEEILSKEAFSLLKNLSVINTDLENNLDRATIEQTYAISNCNKIFTELIDAGMLQKKKGKEEIYQFSYHHIPEAIRDEENKESHEKAIEYYKNKIKKSGEGYDDAVELLFHQSKSNPDEELVKEFLKIRAKIKLVSYGFKRLPDVGEELKNCFDTENRAAKISRVSLTLKFDFLFELGSIEKTLGKWEDAKHNLEECIELAEKVKYPSRLARSCYWLGDVLYRTGNLEESFKYFNRALEISKNHKKWDRVTPILERFRSYYRLQKESDKIIGIFDECLKLCSESNDLHSMAKMMTGMARAYIDIGNYEMALFNLDESMKIWDNLKEDRYLKDRAETLERRGDALKAMGKWDESLGMYEEVYQIKKQLGDVRGEAGLLSVIAATLHQAERNTLAVEKDEESLKIGRKTRDVVLLTMILAIGGSIYRDLENWDKATQRYEECYQIGKDRGYPSAKGSGLRGMGEVYMLQGELKEALVKFQDSLKIWKDLKREYDIGLVTQKLGKLHLKLGEYDRAYEFAIKANEIFETSSFTIGGIIHLGKAKLTLAEIYLAQKKYKKAVSSAKQARDIFEKLHLSYHQKEADEVMDQIKREMENRKAKK